jgi:diguanylate cyclase (GGDEF)-like protein/PAS domain S-box-containing protein
VTSWNRRLTAAQQRPNRGARTFSKELLLREAVEAGVLLDDQAAILALAKVAVDRPGYRTVLTVRTGDRAGAERLFEIAHTGAGPVARAVAPGNPGDTDAEGDEPAGVDVSSLINGTLVQTPDLVAIFASVGHEALWANDAFVTLVPIRESETVHLVEILDEWSKGHYEVKVLPALARNGRWRGRLTLVAADGGPLPVSAVVVAHRDRHGEIEAVTMVARDLTELHLAEARASASETRFSALVANVSDLIAVLDPDGVIRYTSPATIRALGRSEGELTGTKVQDLIHPDDLPETLDDLTRADEQGVGAPVGLRVRSADGSWRHLEIVVSDLTANPAIGGMVINARDVTERVEAVQNLASKAFTDQLTGLPNRLRFLDRLSQALHESRDDTPVAVLLFDLDRFKAVNDLYGQPVADMVIKTVAARLADTAGSDVTTARLRSDEFAVVLPEVVDPADAMRLAHRLREAVIEPVSAEGNKVTVTASIGVAFSSPGCEPESLLGDADHAMTHAKRTGGDRYEVFSSELADRKQRRRSVEQRLRAVLHSDGIVVHYQPIIDIATDRLISAEALLRVDDGEGSLLSPAEFIEAAESSGLITRIGKQMIEATCAQLAGWRSEIGSAAPGQVSINLSPRQLADPSLSHHVLQAVTAAGVDPGQLCLEITESLVVGREAAVDASISYLRTLGVKFGLDEFGAGHSSLAYLRRLPLDFVKIDRSLIAGLGIDDHDTAIVRAIIQLAHDLGLVVVGVGVETPEQLDMMQLLGCDQAQGFLFSPPVPAAELLRYSPG